MTLSTEGLLREVIRFQWPRCISNERLYQRTGVIQWSTIILKHRLSWFGHLLRLPVDSTARKALCQFLKPAKRPVGPPVTTWLSTVLKDLKNYSSVALVDNISDNIDSLAVLYSDRLRWNRVVGSMMFARQTNMQ